MCRFNLGMERRPMSASSGNGAEIANGLEEGFDFSRGDFQSNAVVLASPEGLHLKTLDHVNHQCQFEHNGSNLKGVSVTDGYCGRNHFSTV